MSDVIVMRVDRTGRVIAGNQAAAVWLSNGYEALCRRTVDARNSDGSAICHPHCAARLVMGEPPGRVSCRAIVHNSWAQLDCHRVNEEVIVIVRQGEPVGAEGAERLSRRESEVLRLVAKGLTSRQIAGELGICVSTVRTHVENARQRLAAHSRAEAVGKALASGQL